MLQRIKTVNEENVPVQTHGNCGLFTVITSMRAFGFSKVAQKKALSFMDELTLKTDDTFVGELFTVDLMVELAEALEVDGKKIFSTKLAPFDSAQSLNQQLQKYKDDEGVTLMIAYSKPDEYDKYYKLRGEWLEASGAGGDSSKEKKAMDLALDNKVAVEDFLAKDAHWGMINKIHDDGFVDITDSLGQLSPTSDHGYETLMSIRKLFKSNQSLSSAPFDWTPYLGDKSAEYRQMSGKPVTKDLSSSSRYKKIVQASMEENMDLSGSLVVLSLTSEGEKMVEA